MRKRSAVTIAVLTLIAGACGSRAGTSARPSTPASSLSPSISPSPSPLVAPKGCKPEGAKLGISTENTVWIGPGGRREEPGKACLAAPAGQPFTVTLRNDVRKMGLPFSHNFSVYTDVTVSQELFRGENVLPGQRKTYDLPSIEAGVYLFRCDLHPQYMSGVLVVE
jgi:cupredoxin-like protein